jgi:hypothetical protein
VPVLAHDRRRIRLSTEFRSRSGGTRIESRAAIQEMKQFELDRGRPEVSVSSSRSSFHFENTGVDSTSGVREGIPGNQTTRGPVNQFQDLILSSARLRPFSQRFGAEESTCHCPFWRAGAASSGTALTSPRGPLRRGRTSYQIGRGDCAALRKLVRIVQEVMDPRSNLILLSSAVRIPPQRLPS